MESLMRYVLFILLVSVLGVNCTDSDDQSNSTEDRHAVPIKIHAEPQFNPPSFSEKVNEPSSVPPKVNIHRPHPPVREYEHQHPPRRPLFDTAYQPGYGYDGPYGGAAAGVGGDNGGYGYENGYYDRQWNSKPRGRYPGLRPGYPQRGGGYIPPPYPGSTSDGGRYPGWYDRNFASNGYNGYPDYGGYGMRVQPAYGGNYGYNGYGQPSYGYGLLNGLFG